MVIDLGRYLYTVRACVDRFESWRRGLAKKVDAGQDVSVDFLAGAELVEAASQRASNPDAKTLHDLANVLRSGKGSSERLHLALGKELAAIIAQYPDLRFASTYDKELAVVVDREKARFSSWYEAFPRSCAS